MDTSLCDVEAGFEEGNHKTIEDPLNEVFDACVLLERQLHMFSCPLSLSRVWF
jgi:hypothetical protein